MMLIVALILLIPYFCVLADGRKNKRGSLEDLPINVKEEERLWYQYIESLRALQSPDGTYSEGAVQEVIRLSDSWNADFRARRYSPRMRSRMAGDKNA